jgi:hypothetical protein
MQKHSLIIACGALAHELTQILRLNDWQGVRIQCLRPDLHNRPQELVATVREELLRNQGRYRNTFVAYGDCGTSGQLDQVLEEFGAERLPGAHCYEFFTGDRFSEIAEEEAGTYYLTNFLVRNFDRIVRKGLGIDERPELKELYFGNYRRLVFLAQTEDPELQRRAKAHAEYLGVEYEYHYTGLIEVEKAIEEHVIGWRNLKAIRE